LLGYLITSFSDWRSWWKAPTTREDRYIALVCGAVAGIFIGFIAKVLIGPSPAPWQEFIDWCVFGSAFFATLGFLVPKPIMLISAPFVKILEAF
jgi:hypothetical protein